MSIGLHDYSIYRRDRQSDVSSRGGGVLIAVHHSLVSSQVAVNDTAMQNSAMDVLLVEIGSHQAKLLLIGVYIPPLLSDQLYKDLANFVEEVSLNYLPENVILCGDFNLPCINWTNEPLNYSALQYICPRVISATDSLLHLGLLMDWQQQFKPHSTKGYSLDLLFGSSSVCQHVPVNDSLVIGDPDHHEYALFSNILEESGSENKPMKNFLKANFDLINVDLDIDWSIL